MVHELFGVKIKEVRGYAGSAAKRLAVEKGEVDGDCGGWTSMPQDWLRERKLASGVHKEPKAARTGTLPSSTMLAEQRPEAGVEGQERGPSAACEDVYRRDAGWVGSFVVSK